MLKILVLGPPVIQLDDKPLDIQRRQLRTLLFFLACESNGVGRGDLLTRFWPDDKETDARRQLRELLSKLRAQLPSPEDLQTDHDRVWLNSQTVYSDVQDFLTLVQPLQGFLDVSNHIPQLSDDLVERLEEAVALWRGPTFLAGARISNTPEFDDWIREKTSSLEYARLQCLEHLANHFASIEELDKAILYIRKALDSDSLNEGYQAQLLTLFFRARRINEAQTYYSYLKDLYRRELNIAPPEVLSLIMEDVEKKPFDRRNHPQMMGSWQHNTDRFFVGRTRELAEMEKIYRQGAVVAISGDIGSGKTQFIKQFYANLEVKPRLFYTTCHVEDFNLPLQPIVNLIREYITTDDWENLDPRWIKPMNLLVPDIIRKTYGTQGLTDASSKEGRMELFEAIHRLFLVASRSSRILIAIDDIHWSDLDTFEALMYLTRQGFFGRHGFFVFSASTDISDPRVREIVQVDTPPLSVPRINLGPFSRSETAELCSNILGKSVSESLTERLYKATGGNPLYIVETLNAIRMSNAGGDINQEDIPLADSLSAIILEKEKSLSNSAREVLYVAAVCGMEFQIDVLEQIHLYDSSILIRCLEELEEKHFIHPIKTAGNLLQYSFNQSLIHNSIINRLSYARLHFLHEQIAKAMSVLKGTLSNRQASIIARHYDAAGKPLQAFQFWIKAGIYARSLFSIHEAFNAYQRANGICLEHGMEIPIKQLYELYSEWGDLAYNIMDMTALDECYSAMYEIGTRTNDPLLIGAGLSGLALPAVSNLEGEKAMVMLEQSIQMLDKSDNLLEKIIARTRMGLVLTTTNQNQRAVEVYQEAIKLGKELPNQVIRQAVASAQYQLSILYCIMGWPEKAQAIGNQGLLNAYLLISRPTIQSNAHISMAMAAYYRGDFSEANEHIRRCLRVSESLQNLRTISLAQLLQARINLHYGHLDIAWRMAQKALKISEERGYYENISDAYCIRGDIYLIIQDFPDAIREYSHGSQYLSGSFPGLNCHYRMGYAYVRNGDYAKGMKILENTIQIARQAGLDLISLSARHLISFICMQNDNREEAQKREQEVVNECADRGLSMIVFPESLQQAQLIYDTLESEQAEVIIANLLNEAGIMPGPWLDILIKKLALNPFSEIHFDKERFFRFLESKKV
ncbi:MAG: AAA family ATPase [Leptolinea sp.]|jgi:DNA-binding SARP family transcriptional activator/Tfp pilus assembly protein PilF|nr:AAA family ATPase [Leptolinea sp.]